MDSDLTQGGAHNPEFRETSMAQNVKRSKQGLLFKKSDGILKDWKQYEFVFNQTYFHYFKAEKLKGQFCSSLLKRVDIPANKRAAPDGMFLFEVHFSRGSPWILGAASEEERIAWMETLVPGSTTAFSSSHKNNITLPALPPRTLYQSRHSNTQPQPTCPPPQTISQPCNSYSQSVGPYLQPISLQTGQEAQTHEYCAKTFSAGKETYFELTPEPKGLQSVDLESVLPLEDDISQPYGTRARTTTVSSWNGDQLLHLHEEAFCIPPSSLSDHVLIGKGQFGEVFKAILHKGTPGEVEVAVKTTKKNSTDKERADFMKEMNTMSQMLHPNVVRLHGLVSESAESLSIVLEYHPKGDLKTFLIANPRPVKQLVKYMIDVAMGMHYISERGLVHRDLAARNVLLGENEICKVADFGLLRELPEDNSIYQSTSNGPVPLRWMAPESIRDRTFSVASDIWSYGILMWEMFNPGVTPYYTLSNIEYVLAVNAGTRLPIPNPSPNVVAKLMKSCWYKEPEKRPSFLIISNLLITKGLTDAELK